MGGMCVTDRAANEVAMYLGCALPMRTELDALKEEVTQLNRRVEVAEARIRDIQQVVNELISEDE